MSQLTSVVALQEPEQPLTGAETDTLPGPPVALTEADAGVASYEQGAALWLTVKVPAPDTVMLPVRAAPLLPDAM